MGKQTKRCGRRKKKISEGANLSEQFTFRSDEPFECRFEEMADFIAVGKSLTERCMKRYGWKHYYGFCVFRAYRQFLCIKKMTKDWSGTLLSPSRAVELMWRQHADDTVNYDKYCMKLCGHTVCYDTPLSPAVKQLCLKIMVHKLLAYYPEDEIDKEIWKEAIQLFRGEKEKEGGDEISHRQSEEFGESLRVEVGYHLFICTVV
jgi:hypothetical protein